MLSELKQLRELAATTRAIVTSRDPAVISRLVVERAAVLAAADAAILSIEEVTGPARVAASVGADDLISRIGGVGLDVTAPACAVLESAAPWHFECWRPGCAHQACGGA